MCLFVNLIKISLQIQLGAIVIPKSTNKQRIQDNIDVFDFELNNDEMETMHSLRNTRLVAFRQYIKHKDYPFYTEF